MIIAPATLISITILLFNLTGDAIRDRLLEKRGAEFDSFKIKNLNISDLNGTSLIKT